jgi:hypothetical protein
VTRVVPTLVELAHGVVGDRLTRRMVPAQAGVAPESRCCGLGPRFRGGVSLVRGRGMRLALVPCATTENLSCGQTDMNSRFAAPWPHG